MSGDSTTNGSPVRPDKQTKTIFGIAYTFSMAVVGFLSLQVWILNGRMARMEAQQEAAATISRIQNSAISDRLEKALTTQSEWNARMERLLEKLNEKLDDIKEAGK